jgi:NADH-quinone oxidoreductase subunit J
MLLAARLVLSLAMIVAAIFAVRSSNLIHAALSLAVGSSTLALIFFLLGAPYAGSVQLSVGAGVLSILFILAISLTESRGGRRDE